MKARPHDLGPVPPLPLPAARLHVGRDAGDVRRAATATRGRTRSGSAPTSSRATSGSRPSSTFLPVQMCHVRVNERYRVWHDACHLDDARMAPVEPQPLRRLPAGPVDAHDVRAGRARAGARPRRLARRRATTTCASSRRRTRCTASRSRGRRSVPPTTTPRSTRLPRRRDAPARRQARHPAADRARRADGGRRLPGAGPLLPRHHQRRRCASTRTSATSPRRPTTSCSTRRRPRPSRRRSAPASRARPTIAGCSPSRTRAASCGAAAGLAASARALRGYDDALAAECLAIAKEIWDATDESAAGAARAKDRPSARIGLAVELLLTTGDRRYADYLVGQRDAIVKGIRSTGWVVGRALPLVGDAGVHERGDGGGEGLPGRGARAREEDAVRRARTSPTSGAPAGASRGSAWSSTSCTRPSRRSSRRTRCSTRSTSSSACTPGRTTRRSCRASARGRSRVGYGLNRADWGYIPGGSVSGTALIRPDFPELLEWPYLWQQTEYVLGGGTTDYLFLVLAADHLLNRD